MVRKELVIDQGDVPALATVDARPAALASA
jgi:hypothetical protein